MSASSNSGASRETWWLMYCDLPDRLNWARLRVVADGSAEVLDCDGTVTRFPNAEEAHHWLEEDEFSFFDDALRADHPEVSWAQVDVPTGEDDRALVRNMLVVLKPPRDAHAELRVYGEPEARLGFEAVTIHPLADDRPTLDRLRMSPDECKSCDLYWVINDTLFFVAIASTALSGKKPFTSVHKNGSGTTALSFYVVTERCPITGPVVSDVLRWLKQWIDATETRFGDRPGKTATVIADFDVLEATSQRARFMLVVQRPGVSFDDLVAFEERVEAALQRKHDLDGHDLGSGEGNVFVHTSNPWEAFNLLVVAGLVTVVPGLKVAFRELTGETYTLLWPPESTSFHIS